MGAPESNAGDDFHFWWAASRALALIVPGTDSRLLLLEGLGRVDDPDDNYEAVDVAEYVGGEALSSATTVVMSQLKHSTRHPDQAWTVSRICTQRIKRAADGTVLSRRSVIADLAGIYKQLLGAGHSRGELLRKVKISLISNQPGDPRLEAAVAAAAEWARSRPAVAGKAALLRALSTPHVEMIRKLDEAIGNMLRSHEFCDFLAVLDLSQTGALGRAVLARSVRVGAASLTPGRGPDSARRLFDLVRREALPESRRHGIRAVDVLAELGVADPQDLYPAIAQLLPLDNPLPAPGAQAVVDAIRRHPSNLVLAHGQAGAGKTTALRQVIEHLPPGSVVTLYDCYGRGEYLSSGEERHTPQRFVMQIVNDLAQQCGTPLLVHPPATEEDLWRLLRRVLEKAVASLDHGACLVLAVDAADNAAFAASQRGDRGFLLGLVGLSLPPHTSVVLTARTHRVESLRAPQAVKVQLMPFDGVTSAAHLRRYRADASDDDAATFHARTGGNPRVQYYALMQGAADGRDMPTLLETCARTPDALFKEIVDSGLQVSGADAGGQRWLALMLALARPVSTQTLAAALDVDPASVVAFANGLVPGVTLTKGAIQFRDEDFENYVRSRVNSADVTLAHDKLAEMFLAIRAQDADAAAHVADHLFAAGRLDDVVHLVLDEDWPEAVPDGFRRAQVQDRRLDLAARAAARTGDASAAVRVAVRGCDTASRLHTLSSLVDSHLDLVARHADVDLLRTYVLRQTYAGQWLAPVYMRFAAALARDPERHAAARAELDHADAWLRRWARASDRDTGGWRVDEDDVAHGAEARFRIDGLDAAVAELLRWRPAKFALDAAIALAKRIGVEVGSAAVREALRRHRVPTALQGPFLAYAASPTSAPAREWIDEVVSAVLAADPGDEEPWHRLLLDVAARHGDRQRAAALARHLAHPLPPYPSAFSSGDADGVAALRLRAITEVLDGTDIDLDDIVPPSLRPKVIEQGEGDSAPHAPVEDRRAHERREWLARIDPLLSACRVAVRAVIGDADANEVMEVAAAELATRTDKAGHRWFTYDSSYRAWAAIIADAAVDAGAPPEVIDQLAEAAPLLLRDGAPDLWLDLAAGLSRRGTHADRAADLCQQAGARVREHPYPAPERLDLLARAATIAGEVVPDLGRLLFDQAVDVATGINDDAARVLAVHADLASRAVINGTDRSLVASGLVRVAETVAPHVTDGEIIPYASLAGAAARFNSGIALAAVSRWDDEDRIRLGWTLRTALLGAVDGGSISASRALALDHLIENDWERLKFDLAAIDRLRPTAAGTLAARMAVRRIVDWLRRDVPASAQPALGAHILAWAAERNLTQHVQPELASIVVFHREQPDRKPQWRDHGSSAEVQAILTAPATRSLVTLADDVAVLTEARVYGQEMSDFITAVVGTARPEQRLNALRTVADLPSRVGAGAVLQVLASYARKWRDWPGVTAWASDALPALLDRHLSDVASRQSTGVVVDQLRSLANDDAIRHAVLSALPEARPQLTAYGWQNIAALLGRLCGPPDAAEALNALLTDRLGATSPGSAVAMLGPTEPIVPLLWSALGHPRREIRWRTAHAIRELLILPDNAASEFAAALVDRLDHGDPGPYRAPNLHFYQLSAAAALLAALARVASEKPAILEPHLPALIRHATSRDLPHAQIRELARWTALAIAGHNGSDLDQLHHANQPVACATDRKPDYHSNDRLASKDWRYRFDQMDTIPYWYTPLARVFGLPVDAVAEGAERWIIDKWGFNTDDWMTDARELRDQNSWNRMNHRHGSIPPEENLRLYLEYHAMHTAAGMFVDERRDIHISTWDDAGDPWQDWLEEHLPVSAGTWLADLRNPVPVEPELFGLLPPLELWEAPDPAAHDSALGLVAGRLSDWVMVAGQVNISRRHAYGQTYIRSALVTPAHAVALQRALAAAADPTDWKLPDEDDLEFEVDHDPFILRGWLTDPAGSRDVLDEHDPYAQGLRRAVPLPGRSFRSAAGATIHPNGLSLRNHRGDVIVRAEQWADPDTDEQSVTSSGHYVRIERASLLHHLAQTGVSLIVEVQIGRHRRNTDTDEYRPPRSRIYLIDAAGAVTAR